MDPAAVLSAVSMTRQHVEVFFEDDGHNPTGEVCIKSGQLLRASAGRASGEEAFFAVLGGVHSFFRVERLADSAAYGEPIGQLIPLLLAAPAKAAAGASVARASTPAAPVAAPAPRLKVAPPAAKKPVRPVARPAPPKLAPRPRRTSDTRIAPTPTGRTPAAPIGRVPDNGSLQAAVADLRGLQTVVLGTLPDCLTYAHWATRGYTGVNPVELAAYTAQLVATTTMAFGGSTPPPIEALVRLADFTVMVRQVSERLVAGFVFESALPLGFVRVQIERAMPALGELD